MQPLGYASCHCFGVGTCCLEERLVGSIHIRVQPDEVLWIQGDERPRSGGYVKVNEPAPPSEEATEEEDPVWVRREKLRKLQEEEGVDLPFPFYLMGSGVVAIAAIGSVFEFINKRPVFGIIQPDSPVWLPLLAFFALAGLPVSGILFFRAVESANKAAEQSDAIDRL